MNISLTPKDLLENIWDYIKAGIYDPVDTAEAIAKNISRTHLEKYPAICNLIKSIKAHESE